MKFIKDVSSGTVNPELALKWIGAVTVDNSIDDFADSGPFPTWDAKIAAAFAKIITGDLARRVQLLEEKMFREHQRILKGRQIWWLILQDFKVSGIDEQVIDQADLHAITLHNDNLAKFMHDWEYVLQGIANPPSDEYLEYLFFDNSKNLMNSRT